MQPERQAPIKKRKPNFGKKNNDRLVPVMLLLSLAISIQDNFCIYPSR